jgi:hypothetical protein
MDHRLSSKENLSPGIKKNKRLYVGEINRSFISDSAYHKGRETVDSKIYRMNK